MALLDTFLAGLFKPCQKSVQHRFAAQKPPRIALLRIDILKSILDVKQIAAELKALCCLGSFGPFACSFDGFIKAPSSMGPAANPGHIGETIVTSIGICDQVTLKPFQELFRVFPRTGGLVLEKHDPRDRKSTRLNS